MENVQEELEAHLKNTVILIGMEAFDDSKPILTQCNEVFKKTSRVGIRPLRQTIQSVQTLPKII